MGLTSTVTLAYKGGEFSISDGGFYSVPNGTISILSTSGYSISLQSNGISLSNPFSCSDVTRVVTITVTGGGNTETATITIFASRGYVAVSSDGRTVTGCGPNMPSDTQFSLVPTDFPTTATAIAASAFDGRSWAGGNAKWSSVNQYLTSVTLPAGIQSIGDYAFAQCANITSIIGFPSTLTSLGTYSFVGVGNWSGVADLSATRIAVIPDSCFMFCGSLTEVVLPPTVTQIDTNGFRYMTNLQKINLRNVSTFGSSALAEGGIREVEIVGDVVTLGVNSSYYFDINTTQMPGMPDPNAGVFGRCTSLTRVRIIANETNIGLLAFGEASSLTHCGITGVKSLGYAVGAFAGCRSLKYLTIQGTYNLIPPFCFTTLDIESTSIQYGVENIYLCAFLSCGKCRSYSIPSTVKKIVQDAFHVTGADGLGHPNYYDLYFAGNAPSDLSGSFQTNLRNIYYKPGTTGWTGMKVYSNPAAKAPWEYEYPAADIVPVVAIPAGATSTITLDAVQTVFQTAGGVSQMLNNISQNWGAAIVPVPAKLPSNILTRSTPSAPTILANSTSTTTVAAQAGDSVTLTSVSADTILYIPSVSGSFDLVYGGTTYTISYDSSGNPRVNGVTYMPGDTFMLGTFEFNVLGLGSMVGQTKPGGGGGVPCFMAGAPVLTPTGYRKIEDLTEGDMVVTGDGRAVPIQRVKKSLVTPGAAVDPYVIPKGRFGATRRLLISPKHNVQVEGKMTEARWLGLRQEEQSAPFVYYNLELPEWERDTLVVAGVVCESLAPVRRVTMPLAAFKKGLMEKYGVVTPAVLERVLRTCHLLPDGSVEAPVMRR